MQMVPQASDWLSILQKYGLATFLSVVLIGYLGFVTETQRRSQQKFTDSLISTNEARAEVERKQTDIQAQQAKALADIVPLLQQIRDDQRRGAWLEHKPNGTGTE